MRLLLITPPPSGSLPPGYNAVFYADGLTTGLTYGFYTPTPDDLRTSPTYPNGIDTYIQGSDNSITSAVANALGYAFITLTSAVNNTLTALLHTPGAGNAKGTFKIDGFVSPPPNNRITDPVSAVFTTGAALGPAMVRMGLLSGTPGDTVASLSWTPGINDTGVGTVNYQVFRGTSPGAITTNRGIVAGLSFIDTGLVNGTTYYYRITAGVNLGLGELLHGNGSAGTFSTAYLSNVVTVTPRVRREAWGTIAQ